MTEAETTEAIRDAVALIDRGLGEIQHRELLSATEVADLLLDVRLALAIVDPGPSGEGDDSRMAVASPN